MRKNPSVQASALKRGFHTVVLRLRSFPGVATRGNILMIKATMIAAAALALGAASPAAALTQQQIKWCEGVAGATPDLMIGGCTAVIQSGRFNAKQLAFAFDNRCIAYMSKHDHGLAIADCNRAVQLDPTPKHYIDRANIHGAMHKYALAAADYHEALHRSPGNKDALVGSCRDEAIGGQTVSAIIDCSRAFHLMPKNSYVIQSRGLAYFKSGKFDESIADLNVALTADPHNAEPLYVRGLAKLKKGDISGGNSDIAAAKAIYSKVDIDLEKYGIGRTR